MKRNRHTIPDASVLPTWRKSSYSGSSGNECLEVSPPIAYATWRKSTYSSGSSEACLEVNDTAYQTDAHIPVRDSKNPHGPAVVFSALAWTAFVAAVGTTTSLLGG